MVWGGGGVQQQRVATCPSDVLLPRLRHLPRRWGLAEYHQENSCVCITGLSANQSALSKHTNLNSVLGRWALMTNILSPGPRNPEVPQQRHKLCAAVAAH